MSLADAVTHGLAWGLALSAYLTVTFVGLSVLNAELWLEDYPPDIQRAHGPMSEETRRQRRRLGVPVLLGGLGLAAYASLDFVWGDPSAGRFAPMAVHTFVLLMTFNLIDLVLIDWVLFVRIRPDWVVLPGTEGLDGYSSYAFHARAFVNGTIGIVVVSLLVGLVAGLT